LPEPKVPLNEADPTTTRLELLLYIFRNRLRKAKRAYARIFRTPGSVFEISWTRSGNHPVLYDTPSRRASLEFVVIMSDFILPNRLLNLEDTFGMLRELSSNEQYLNQITQAQTQIAEVDHAPPALMSSLYQQMSAREIFVDVCQQVIFNDDIPAIDFAERLNGSVTATAAWNHFHNYCMIVFEVLQNLDRVIDEQNAYPHPQRVLQCIYCKSTTNVFKSVEHVAPESLGNEISILPRGYVCTQCNNELSRIEDNFLNTLPMSIVQFQAINIDKKGRFPSVHFQRIHFQRTSPNSIRATSQAGRSSQITTTALPDGMHRMNIPDMSSRFDYRVCARTLVKMALGVMAIKQGRDVVLQSRYDLARTFVLHGGTFPTWLFMRKQINWHRGAAFQMWPETLLGTLMIADLFGAWFAVGLEPQAASLPNPDASLAADYAIYDLRRTDPGPHI